MTMRTELENLKLVLSSPRPRAPDTLTGYLSVANNFLTWLGDKIPPGEMDLRRYFVHRREQGISDNSLATYFAVLRKLYQANSWQWPLLPGDRPLVPEETRDRWVTVQEIEQLIKNRKLYSKGECFYLAIATIYVPRRIELARITRKSIKGNTLYIDTAKKGRKGWHLIPDEILPYIEAYKPDLAARSTLSAMFARICKKGLGKEKPGYGWHSFRYVLDTLLPGALFKAGKELTLAGYFLRWSRREFGEKFHGTPMGGTYARLGVLSADPFFADREVFEVHPFLPLWADIRQS